MYVRLNMDEMVFWGQLGVEKKQIGSNNNFWSTFHVN